MSFGERLRERREQLNMSRRELAEALGVSVSAIGNYETGISAPKEEVLLRLFDSLQVDPNTLYRDHFRGGQSVLTHDERELLDRYRSLSAVGRDTVRSVMNALCAYRDELEQTRPVAEERRIPLYCSPAAAGFAAPVFGEDFDYIPVGRDVPPGAEFAVRIQGDSMAPWIADGSVVYVNRDPLQAGDVGIFCVDGGMLCKQYYRDPLGTVYLFSLNRERSDADVLLTADSGRTLVSFGRVMMHRMPLPGKGKK
ncbi:putative Xre family DNA-binding protein [Oscillibacter valericigenes Sjm18-20]|nr:putative Xre family DNA-binding protein [Oscillibacter valericigenes Sjm18-20]